MNTQNREFVSLDKCDFYTLECVSVAAIYSTDYNPITKVNSVES